MRLFSALCALLLLAAPAGAAGRLITLYLDGARFEYEATTTKGFLEVSLPASMQAGSLRIKPMSGCVIERVEIVPAKSDPRRTKEMAKFTQRRDSLTDRLQALDAREAIFKIAAKSQSGKAPRKTKTNPEPLASVRQGTEYALAQLEGVYRARRLAESELKSVEARLTSMKREGNASVAKVRLAGREARILVSYLRSDLKWVPAYDFRLNKSGEVNVVMRAALPDMEKEIKVAVVPAILAESANEAALPILGKGLTQVASFTFPVEQDKYSSTSMAGLLFSFRNQSTRKLPAGEASCYRQEEYLGETSFSGSFPGEIKEMVCGK
ncbi:MAG TPA: hypothetical protein VHN12_07830 [Geobacteraceae bacterium]|nr:hypothetical protein [Geobacteraceae bacterium]